MYFVKLPNAETCILNQLYRGHKMTTIKQSSLRLLSISGVVTIGAVTGALVGGVTFMAYTALLGKGTGTALAAKSALGLSGNTTSSSSLIGLLFTSTGGALGGGATSLGVVRKQVNDATQTLENKTSDVIQELESKVDDLSQQLEVSQSKLTEHKQKNRPTINVDLQQIKGIGPKYSELLQEAGIKTIKELAQASSQDLSSLLESSIEKHLFHLDEWIIQAQQIVTMNKKV